jgi:hypothetical protein
MLCTLCCAGLSEALAQAMWEAHGPSILAVLDSPPREAGALLQRCRKVGPKSAEKFKSRWDASFGVDSAAGPGGSPLGLRLTELLAAPPALGFGWGPDTRCYTPTLHQVGPPWGAEAVCRLRLLGGLRQC